MVGIWQALSIRHPPTIRHVWSTVDSDQLGCILSCETDNTLWSSSIAMVRSMSCLGNLTSESG